MCESACGTMQMSAWFSALLVTVLLQVAGPKPAYNGGRSEAAPRRSEPVFKLGRATSATAIYARPEKISRVLSKIKSGSYLVLGEDRQDWRAIPMAGGKIGWAPKAAVELLDYEIVTPT